MIRHLFDCNTVNPGDVAIGHVMADYMTSRGIEFEQGGPDAPDADLFVIGGGHLLQGLSAEYYRGYRREGTHILYAMGVSDDIGDCSYLRDYRLVVARTGRDRALLMKAGAGKVEVHPCPANILPVEDSGYTVEPGTIGVQVFYPGWPLDYIELLEGRKVLAFPWRRSIRGETLDDLVGATTIAEGLGGKIAPTDLSPGQYRHIIGQLDFFICQSLHAAMWAYQSNVNFIVNRYADKILFWTKERGLTERTFRRPNQIPGMIEKFTGSDPHFNGKRDRDKATAGLERLCEVVKGG